MSQTPDNIDQEIHILQELNAKGRCPNIPQLLFSGFETWWNWRALVHDTVGTPLSNLSLPLPSELKNLILSEVRGALNFMHQVVMFM